MLEKLAKSRAQVVKTARLAGMSQIASGVLHNVGNVLNSVNISASTVAQRLETMSLEELRRIDTILEDKKDVLPDFIRDDPKGKHLQPFIHALTTQLGQERDSILAEVSSLNDGIDHICELIKSQQSYAIKADLVEPLDLGEKMDEAFEITGTAIAVDPDIQVVREYEALPEVMLDRHRLAEVLVNLIQNARQAMEEAGTNPKRLTLCVAGHGDERVRLEVRDNGPGIEPENITRIFNLGFTTRKVGHGYGLHTAANAAVEMGGTLTARSDGAGHGATLVLELPLRVATALGEAI
jgi:signal transduction histidine kinase